MKISDFIFTDGRITEFIADKSVAKMLFEHQSGDHFRFTFSGRIASRISGDTTPEVINYKYRSNSGRSSLQLSDDDDLELLYLEFDSCTIDAIRK